MTQEEIIDGNKLINKFINYKNIGELDKEIYGKDSLYIIKHLKYHSSWSWLMPVVEKIEYELQHPFHIVKSSVVIKENNTISSKSIINHSNNPITLNKIEAIWFAVIEFIKWYNKNK